MKDVFGSCNAASEYLQRSAIDLLAAIEAVNNLRATLLSSRTDESYAAYEEKATALLECKRKIPSMEDSEADVSQPSQKRARRLPARLCDGQSILDEHVAFQTPTTTESSGAASDLKVSFYFIFVDKLTAALDERFGKATCEMLSWMAAFSPKRWNDSRIQQSSMEITKLCETYGVSYAAVTEYRLFAADAGRASCESFNDLLKYMFDNDFHRLYPNLFQLAKLCATIPVTSSDCERTHSKVARVKSAVRSSMTDDRLEHLVLVNVEQDIAGSLGLASLVDIFKMQGPSGERRVKL